MTTLVERLRTEPGPSHETVLAAASRIEAQEETIKKLREALAECIEYATSTTVVEEVARAALADTGSKI